MRELKIDRPFPVVSSNSSDLSLKQSRTSRLASDMAQEQPASPLLDSSEIVSITLPEVPALNLPTDAVTETPKRRSRTQKAKPAAAKAKKSPALTKPNWDVSKQLILERFRQLEQECTNIKTQAAELNQQSVAIQAEMAHLRTIANKVTPVEPSPAAPSSYRVQPTSLRDVGDVRKMQAADTTAAPIIADMPPVYMPGRAARVLPVSSQLSSKALPVSDKLRALAHSTYGQPRSPQPIAPARSYSRPTPWYLQLWVQQARRLTRRWWQTMPKAKGAIAIDALGSVFGAVMLRGGLQIIVGVFPFISGLSSLLLLVLLGAAIYVALFKPKANAVIIYRLLLIAFGLWLGGKL